MARVEIKEKKPWVQFQEKKLAFFHFGFQEFHKMNENNDEVNWDNFDPFVHWPEKDRMIMRTQEQFTKVKNEIKKHWIDNHPEDEIIEKDEELKVDKLYNTYSHLTNIDPDTIMNEDEMIIHYHRRNLMREIERQRINDHQLCYYDRPVLDQEMVALNDYYYNNLLLQVPESFWSDDENTFRSFSEIDDDEILIELRDPEIFNKIAHFELNEYHWLSIKNYHRTLKYNDSPYHQKVLKPIETIHLFYVDVLERDEVRFEGAVEPHFKLYYASNHTALNKFLKSKGSLFLFGGFDFCDFYCPRTGDISLVCCCCEGWGRECNLDVDYNLQSKLKQSKTNDSNDIGNNPSFLNKRAFKKLGLKEDMYPEYLKEINEQYKKLV